MFTPKWYNIELKLLSAEVLKEYLRNNGIRFESSGCFDLIHFEIFVTSQQIFDSIERFLIFLPD